MATDQRNLPGYFSGNVDFQTWCQGIHAQLAACGMVQTADTGQINNTTVARPAGTNASAGYEIWRFNDTTATNGQTTNPLYFKLEYGTYTSNTAPSLWTTVGTGSDGAGNITGATIPRQQHTAGTTYAGAQSNTSYCSGDGGRLALYTNVDQAIGASAYALFIDRFRDATGTPTGEGFARAALNGNDTTLRYSVMVGSVNVLNWQSQSGYFQSIPNGQRLYNNSLIVTPLMYAIGQVRFLSSGILYNRVDLGSAPGLTITATNFGGTHTYLLLGLGMGWQWTGNSGESLAMLWE